MKRPSRIAVDWDSTIAVETWPEMGEWLPGAESALKRLAEIYDEVVIFTLRVAPFEVDEKTPRDPYDQIFAIDLMLARANMPQNIYVWTKPYKPPCEFFIDDRNIEFNGDWGEALAQVGLRRLFAKGTVFTSHEEELMESPGQRAMRAYCAPSASNGDPGDEQPFEHDSPFVDQGLAAVEAETNRAYPLPEEGVMRTFETGATRNAEVDPDYHGFFSPVAMHAYGEYMHNHRLQADGSLRDSDNWQRGMPQDAYVRSLTRHTHDVELIHDGFEELARGDVRDPDKLKAHLCAIIFNAQGMLFELLKAELREAA